jgi:hypothetical protein
MIEVRRRLKLGSPHGMNASVGSELQACGADRKFKIQWLVVGTVCVPSKFPAKRLVLIQGRRYRDCGDHLINVPHCFETIFDTGGAVI